MRLVNKDQKWRKREDGTMELIEDVEVEREIEPPTELEELSNYVLDVDFRVVMLEMGL